PHHVSPFVDHARNVIARTVDRLCVTKGDLTPALELVTEGVVGIPATLAVLDRDHELLSFCAALGERRVRALDREWDVPTDEGQGLVPAQDAGEQPRLAEDLEPVA